VPVESRIILDIFGQKDQALRHSRLDVQKATGAVTRQVGGLVFWPI